MYQDFEDYACPTQFPVDLKTDEIRLVLRYGCLVIISPPGMTTPPPNIYCNQKKKSVVIFRCVVIIPQLPTSGPTKSRRGTHIIKRAP